MVTVFGIGAEASLALADHGIPGIEVEIDHGAEIEIEAGLRELLPPSSHKASRRSSGEAKLGFLPTLHAEGK